MSALDEPITPLVEIESRVQERAKDLHLDLSTDEGINAGLRALIEDQILRVERPTTSAGCVRSS